MILSIENHCSVKQQQAMAHYMKAIFGSKLYFEPIEENQQFLPSPEELKGKVLVKVSQPSLNHVRCYSIGSVAYIQSKIAITLIVIARNLI